MSYGDEQVEPGPDESRVLSPGDLVDLRIAHDRALVAIPEAVLAFRTNDGAGMMDALGAVMSGLATIRSELRLDDVDDDEPDDTVSQLERFTRSGGRE
jgi:hypothetical protein